MADEQYTVKINRREGIVEITGPDKEWISHELERLAVVYEGTPADAEEPGEVSGNGPDETADAEKVESGEPEAQKPKKRRAAPRPTNTKPSELASKLTKDVTTRLHAYEQERTQNLTSHQNRSAVIATFLEDELGITAIDGADLIAVYRAMGWAPPKNPSAVIQNAIDRNGYFGGWRDGKTSLTPTGDYFGRHGSKEPKADK